MSSLCDRHCPGHLCALSYFHGLPLCLYSHHFHFIDQEFRVEGDQLICPGSHGCSGANEIRICISLVQILHLSKGMAGRHTTSLNFSEITVSDRLLFVLSPPKQPLMVPWVKVVFVPMSNRMRPPWLVMVRDARLDSDHLWVQSRPCHVAAWHPKMTPVTVI